MTQENLQKQYTAVFRCMESMIRVPSGHAITVNPLYTDAGTFTLKIATRSDIVDGFKSPVPRELWIEVVGPASDLQPALDISGAIANDFARQVALAANAWHGLVNLHLVFDSSAGDRERDFVQNWIADEVGLPRQARLVQPDLLARVITAISNVPDEEQGRLRRAIRQYTDALQYWRGGDELYALSHLWMGVEAITIPIMDREVIRRGLSDRKALPRGEHERYPDAWVRRELIFHGDLQTYQLAKKASDGFEHGYTAIVDAHENAVACLLKTAHFLRKAILSLAALSDEDRRALDEKPYATPAKTDGFERMIFGTISSPEAEVAAAGQQYPHVRWAFQLKDFEILPDGGSKMRVTQNITPFIGASAKFSPKRVRMSGPTETTHTEVEAKTIDPEVTEAKVGVSGIHVGIDEPDAAQWPISVGGLVLNISTLRALAYYWLQKLTAAPIETIEQTSFDSIVEAILNVVAQSSVPEAIKASTADAWTEALSLDEVRRELACAYPRPEGLVLRGRQQNGQSPLLTDSQLLIKWNAEAVELAGRLAGILDTLLESGVFQNVVSR